MKQPVLLRGVAGIEMVAVSLADPQAQLFGVRADEDMLRQRELEHFANYEQLPGLVLMRGAGRFRMPKAEFAAEGVRGFSAANCAHHPEILSAVRELDASCPSHADRSTTCG